MVKRLVEIKAAKVGEILTDLKAAIPVLTLHSTLAESRDEGPNKCKNHKRCCAQGTAAFALAEVVTKTIKDTLTDVKPKAPVEKVVATPADVDA